jgi:hypothetical protein
MTDVTEAEVAVTEPEEAVAEPDAPTGEDQAKDDDRLGQAKTALVHGVESVVDKFTDAVSSIGGHKQ